MSEHGTRGPVRAVEGQLSAGSRARRTRKSRPAVQGIEHFRAVEERKGEGDGPTSSN
jgi:hypothetical protein